MSSEKSYISLKTYEAAVIQSQAFRALANMLNEKLSKYDLQLSEWKLLGQLQLSGDMTPSEIAEVLSIRTPIISRLLKRLEAKSLLIRRRNRRDNRIVHTHITAKGRRIVAELELYLRKQMKDFLSDITHEELEVYLKVLTKIAAKV